MCKLSSAKCFKFGPVQKFVVWSRVILSSSLFGLISTAKNYRLLNSEKYLKNIVRKEYKILVPFKTL